MVDSTIVIFFLKYFLRLIHRMCFFSIENQVLLTKILNHPCLAEEASINKIKKDKLSAEISSQDPSPGKDTDRDESIITSDRNDSATEPLIAKSNSFHLDNAQNHTNGKDLSPVKTVESSEEQIKEVENNTNVSVSLFDFSVRQTCD
jgi:hypothetical protein